MMLSCINAVYPKVLSSIIYIVNDYPMTKYKSIYHVED